MNLRKNIRNGGVLLIPPNPTFCTSIKENIIYPLPGFLFRAEESELSQIDFLILGNLQIDINLSPYSHNSFQKYNSQIHFLCLKFLHVHVISKGGPKSSLLLEHPALSTCLFGPITLKDGVGLPSVMNDCLTDEYADVCILPGGEDRGV